jgi:hypothetical protein
VWRERVAALDLEGMSARSTDEWQAIAIDPKSPELGVALRELKRRGITGVRPSLQSLLAILTSPDSSAIAAESARLPRSTLWCGRSSKKRPSKTRRKCGAKESPRWILVSELQSSFKIVPMPRLLVNNELLLLLNRSR